MKGGVFEVRYQRFKIALFMLFCALTIVLGLMLIGAIASPEPQGHVSEVRRLFSGWFCILGGGYLTAKLALLMWRGSVAYRFDAFGIHMGRTGDSIPWKAISNPRRWVQRVPSGSIIPVRQRWLVIEVLPEFSRKVPLWDQVGRGLYPGLTKHSHFINSTGTDMSLDEIIEGFNKFAPQHAQISSEG